MIMGKNLSDIKKDIALLNRDQGLCILLALDIERLDPASKHSAIVHLEETIGLLKIEHDLNMIERNLPEGKSEAKLKDDSSDKEDAWTFNSDTFVDDIYNDSNNKTVPVQEKEASENERSIEQGNNEGRAKGLHQTPKNDIKQESANQKPVVISLNPDTFNGKIASENDMLKCDLCNVYLPRSYGMKKHEEDPQHLARVTITTAPPKHKEELSEDASRKESITNIPILTGTAHTCDICQRQFKSKEYLRKHKIVHSEKYKCPRCKGQCRNKNPEGCLKPRKMRPSINVPLAKETEEQSKNLKANMSESESCKKNTEGMNLNLYQCPECPNQFNKRNSLVKHRVIHTSTNFDAESQRLNEENEKITEGKSVKKDTEKTLTLKEEPSQPKMGINLFQCPECPNQYNKKSSLVKHKAMHTGKFKCPRCEAPFIERSKLDIHTLDPNNCSKLFFFFSSQKVFF